MYFRLVWGKGKKALRFSDLFKGCRKGALGTNGLNDKHVSLWFAKCGLIICCKNRKIFSRYIKDLQTFFKLMVESFISRSFQKDVLFAALHSSTLGPLQLIFFLWPILFCEKRWFYQWIMQTVTFHQQWLSLNCFIIIRQM